MEWHHPASPRTKSIRRSPSRQDHDHCDLGLEGIILEYVMSKRQTTTSDAYIETFKALEKCFRRVRPHKNRAEHLLQHDNARPHV
jgi:hypothetical protein